MRWEPCYFTSWKLRRARCKWWSAWLWWRKVGFLRRSCSQDLIQLAWRFRWHPKSLIHVLIGCCSCWLLREVISTIFIGGSEVVLNGFDYIGFDVLCFFEGDGCAVDELSLSIGSEAGSRVGYFNVAFLHFGSEEGHSFHEISQHECDKK